LNRQIAGGPYQLLVGFDEHGNETYIVPIDIEYGIASVPSDDVKLTSVKASPQYCYCNRRTHTYWCCYGNVQWNTGIPC
jgi:hypothetical protein